MDNLSSENKNIILVKKASGEQEAFDIEKLKRKNGLVNMEARASKINSTLYVISDKNGICVNFEALLPE